jgi:hypothetical protein
MNTAWVKTIHMAVNKTGIDDDAYRAILSGIGLGSSKDITTAEQFTAVMQAFKALGFRYTPSAGKARPQKVAGNDDFITPRQEYYIRGLHRLACRAKDEKSLAAIIKRIGKVDDISFLKKRDASSVILALRDICWKAGFNPDSREGRE